MDSRRNRYDPKIRHVGFFTPPSPDLTPSDPSLSISPVIIPPPRYNSDNLSAAVTIPLRRLSADGGSAVLCKYDPSEDSVLRDSLSEILAPAEDGYEAIGEFSEDSVNLVRKGDLGNYADVAGMSIGFGLDKRDQEFSDKDLGKGGVAKKSNEILSNSQLLKEKTTKAQRRALQESQRAAKAAVKEGKKSAAASGRVYVAHNPDSNNVKQPMQRKDVPLVTPSAASSSERTPERDRNKGVPPPHMQIDDKSRLEKPKRRSLIKHSEVKKRVELFQHLPQYEYGNQLHDLEVEFFQHHPMHPAVYKVGLQYLAGHMFGGNSRCIAMLKAFYEAIRDYNTPPEKDFVRDIITKINIFISFLVECRPLSISMGNSIRFLKERIAKIPLNLSESEAKSSLCSDINQFINEKIALADRVIVLNAVTKIKNGDVVLAYSSSSVIETIFSYAHQLGKKFRVVVVDSRPKLEGKGLVRRLIQKGIRCIYTHINALSYIMHEVTTVFLGAASVFSNGTVYSRVGTTCVAMVANAFKVPVLICCEAYKFHKKVQLDSICSNELGDARVIAKVQGRMDINYLENWDGKENLQLLNLLYDATPADYISMIITDYGMIPPTSVPVIVHEYGKEYVNV